MTTNGLRRVYSKAVDDSLSQFPYTLAATASGRKRPRILMMADITGAGADYHVGDEAMAEVAIDRLKRLVGAANLTMACAKPDGVPATYGIRAFAYYSRSDDRRRRMWFTKPLSSMKALGTMLYQLLRHDVVFICGGGNLTSQWPEILESRLYLLSWALRLRRRVILVSQTLGPFTAQHRARTQSILRRADWVGVRDSSYSKAQVDFPVHITMDDASYLPPVHSEVTREAISPLLPALAISLRKLGATSNQDLHDLCLAINKIAEQRGFNAIFIPHHSPKGKGDTAIAKDVKRSWSSSSTFHILDPIPRASALKAITGECELVITMRYHQLIFALAMGVPAVGVYSNEYTYAKLAGAFEQFGLKPRVTSVRDAKEALAGLVAQVLDDRESFSSAAECLTRREASLRAGNWQELKELSSAIAD